jgi:hypothetical protein
VEGRLVERNAGHLGDPGEIGIVREQRRTSPQGNGSNHAVDHTPRGDARSAAPAIDVSRAHEVGLGLEREEVEAEEEAE